MSELFAIKGTFAHTPTFEAFEFYEDSFLVSENGKVVGIYKELPDQYRGIKVYDYTGKVIVPGMCDMHIHAPQYTFHGMGQNIEKPEWQSWFDTYCFPAESMYKDLDFAKRSYERLTDDLMHTTTTRLVFFATIHRPATEALMEILDRKGFVAYVGKVNMDRNSMDGLIETTEETIQETRTFVENTKDKYANVKPIITPRYIPTCTDESLKGISEIMKEFNIPVHSHLTEGLDEFEWVKQLKPGIKYYSQAYDEFDMLGTAVPTIMDHCVFPSPEDFQLLCERNVWIAHCPNGNLHGSGTAAPVLKYVRNGANVCLGTDASGGHTLNLMRTITEAMLASKVHWAYTERNGDPNAKRDVLTLANAFYLATKGGGSFWGTAGSFEQGYDLDAVVLDDSRLSNEITRTTYERVERLICCSDDREVHAKFICGAKVL